jgi:Fe-S cluster assembly protein SufB
MEWIDGNLGSKLTMKYPSCYLVGAGAHGEILSIAYAGNGQHQDTGGKVVHAAPHTTSQILSKSISNGTGRATYRGLVKVYEGAETAKSNVECDALLLASESRTDTFPYIEIEEQTASVGHEATVSKIGAEQLFYLMSRGLSEEEAAAMIVRGFIEPIAKLLPLGGRARSGRRTACGPPEPGACAAGSSGDNRLERCHASARCHRARSERWRRGGRPSP